MHEVKTITDEIFLADLARRSGESPQFLKQALIALAGDGVRPDVDQVFGNEGEQSSVDQTTVKQAAEQATKREFTPEQQERLLITLEKRFNNTPVHYDTPGFHEIRKGIDFVQVRASFEADPEAVRKLNWQEETAVRRPGFLV